MDVQILTIGDELLIGQVIDTNASWMAQQLNLHGAKVIKKITVGDDLKDMLRELKEATKHADVVLMTGGLGPTKDDVTTKALAEFFQVELQFHQPTFDRITKLFERWGRSMTDAHRQQCFMPANATLLLNKMGTAPGMWFQQENKVIVSMPGVPYEMKYLMENEVIPKLKARFPSKPIIHRTILTAGEGESRIAKKIEDIEDALPAHIKLAYLPNLGSVRLRLTGVGKEEELLEKEISIFEEKIKDRLGPLVFGSGKDCLEALIGRKLMDQNITLGTAESCSGGYLAHRITSIPGSSKYFQGSIIAYSNDIKKSILGVKESTLIQHGAVSEETVIEMVNGAIDVLKVDIAVSISGIAGPGGGSPEKPVGTTWIAIGNKDKIKTHKVLAGKDRLKNIEYVSVQALNFIRLFLQEQNNPIAV